jgi:hypothetical protein
MPRTHWTPSPCGRLSRPPWWRVTATTTTGPPPRPDGNSGRCACPKPEGLAGTAGALPTFTHMPVGRVGAPALPRGHRRALPQQGTRPHPPERKTSGRDGPQQQKDRASRQPIAASFGAAVLYRGFDHWYRFPYAFLPCQRTRPANGGPFLRRRGPLAALRRTSRIRLPSSFSRPLRRPGAGPLTPPGHMAPRGALCFGRRQAANPTHVETGDRSGGHRRRLSRGVQALLRASRPRGGCRRR